MIFTNNFVTTLLGIFPHEIGKKRAFFTWGLRKTKAEIVVFGINFYIKDVYLNKFNIKNSRYVLGFTLLDMLY
jgi:hypothetical protein